MKSGDIAKKRVVDALEARQSKSGRTDLKKAINAAIADRAIDCVDASEMLRNADEIEMALDYARKGIEQGEVGALFEYALVLDMADNVEAAAKAYLRCLEIEGDTQVFNNLAVMYRDAGRIPEALSNYKQAIEVGDKFAYPSYAELLVDEQIGAPRWRVERIAQLNEDSEPENRERIGCALAEAQRQAGMHAEARDRLTDLWRHGFVPAGWRLIELLDVDPDKAPLVHHYRDMLEVGEDVEGLLGLLLDELGRTREAEKVLRNGISA